MPYFLDIHGMSVHRNGGGEDGGSPKGRERDLEEKREGKMFLGCKIN